MSSKGVLQECHLSVSTQGVSQVGSLENVRNKYCLCSSTFVSAFGFVGFILFFGCKKYEKLAAGSQDPPARSHILWPPPTLASPYVARGTLAHAPRAWSNGQRLIYKNMAFDGICINLKHVSDPDLQEVRIILYHVQIQWDNIWPYLAMLQISNLPRACPWRRRRRSGAAGHRTDRAGSAGATRASWRKTDKTYGNCGKMTEKAWNKREHHTLFGNRKRFTKVLGRSTNQETR